MTETEEGFENLEVRTRWPNEALDFTPWLAQNLNLLGEQLGFRLELVQQERAVGPMSLDILARDTDTGELVAIENQLEWTDTHHLHLHNGMRCPSCSLGRDRVQARVRRGPAPPQRMDDWKSQVLWRED